MPHLLSAFDDSSAEVSNKLKALIAQKRATYDDDRRFVVNFNLEDRGHQYYLQTASLPFNEEEFHYYMKHALPNVVPA